MASINRRPKGHKWIQFTFNSKRHTVRLGKVSERIAREAMMRIEDLITAKQVGEINAVATAWLQGVSSKIRDRLASCGLCDPVKVMTVGQLCDAFLESLDVAGGTRVNIGVVVNNARQFFTEGKSFREITPADAKAFRAWVRDHGRVVGDGPLADTTVGRRCMQVKQIFNFAIDSRWLSRNPFEGMGGWVITNREKDCFVDLETFGQVMSASPDTELRLAFALNRLAGLRCPSEIINLEWSDVLWDQDLIVVRSPKTKRHEGGKMRKVPIFKDLRPWIQEHYDAASDCEPRIFTKYRMSSAGFNNKLERILRRIGIAMWPKPFMNMRASRETELMEEFPIQVVAAWMGHSPKIALMHYAQVKDSHMKKATGRKPTRTGVRITSHSGSEPKAT